MTLDVLQFVHTAGTKYARSSLDELYDLVGRAFGLPTFRRGIEAFIQLGECDLLAYFERWSLLRHELPATALRGVAPGSQRSVAVDESNLREPTLVEDERFSRRHLEALARLAGSIGLSSAPSAFLLWENSD